MTARSRLYHVAEVAALLDCDATHVRRLAADGLLGGLDVALPGARSAWRFTRAGLLEFLTCRGLTPEAAAELLDGLDGSADSAADSIAARDVSGSPT